MKFVYDGGVVVCYCGIVLDCDRVLGHQVIAKFDGYKSGHALNNQLLRNVQNDPSSYEIVTFNNDNDCPISYVSVI